MDCEALRDRFAADPAAGDASFMAHAEACLPCRAFRHRLLEAESLIGRALKVDRVPHTGRVGRAAPAAGPRWLTLGAGLAAALIAALTFWSFAGGKLEVGPTELAAAVVEHWDHEPESALKTAAQVSREDLAEVLFGTADMDPSAAARVSYARICRVGGRFVPHLVVQGEAGPYMVLLMPGEMLESALPLASADGDLAGHILPDDGGSIAVLGGTGDGLEEMERFVTSAVDWTRRP